MYDTKWVDDRMKYLDKEYEDLRTISDDVSRKMTSNREQAQKLLNIRLMIFECDKTAQGSQHEAQRMRSACKESQIGNSVVYSSDTIYNKKNQPQSNQKSNQVPSSDNDWVAMHSSSLNFRQAEDSVEEELPEDNHDESTDSNQEDIPEINRKKISKSKKKTIKATREHLSPEDLEIVRKSGRFRTRKWRNKKKLFQSNDTILDYSKNRHETS
ncbi:hypothetical protein QAD02_008168 [Eretmocerus hayati]|uniref:Uncharacterized protein n=1 Tax=Eretmocerus hayati TaxID=131215 RepID=A0ACC2N737_9HYME|nr:hypothetical protein QAD02_008168 [Eretmocerus hayati]